MFPRIILLLATSLRMREQRIQIQYVWVHVHLANLHANTMCLPHNLGTYILFDGPDYIQSGTKLIMRVMIKALQFLLSNVHVSQHLVVNMNPPLPL